MAATAVAEPEKLFSQEVIIANEYRLRLERTATEEAESITGTVSPADLFGDWRAADTEHQRPTFAEVTAACSEAIGFALEIDLVTNATLGDGTEVLPITIDFTRKQVSPESEEQDASADDANFKRVVMEFEEECEQAETVYLAAKERAKDCKEIFEGKVAEMRAFIKEHKSPRPLPLFDKKPGKNGHVKPASTNGEPRDNPDPIEVLKAFDLTDAIIEKLKKADIKTIGGLVRFQEQKGLEGHAAPLTTIKGIKGATLEKLDNACAAYWAARGRTVESAVAAVAESTQLPAEGAAQAGATEPAEANGQVHQPELSDEKPEPAKRGKRKKSEVNGEASQA